MPTSVGRVREPLCLSHENCSRPWRRTFSKSHPTLHHPAEPVQRIETERFWQVFDGSRLQEQDLSPIIAQVLYRPARKLRWNLQKRPAPVAVPGRNDTNRLEMAGVECRHAKRSLSTKELPPLAHSGALRRAWTVAARDGAGCGTDVAPSPHGPGESRLSGVP